MKSSKLLTNITLVLLAMVQMNCQGNKQAVSLLSNNDFAGFLIDEQCFKQPLMITGDSLQQGAIFFETLAGKTWLKGKPVKISENDISYEAQWQLKGRSVTITFRKEAEKYEFSFKAQPDTGILKWGMSIAASSDEYFTGLFEHVVDGNQKESWKEGIKEVLNLRGQTVEMSIRPTLSLYCPFYLSSNGYGLFVEGTQPGRYDICKTIKNRVSVAFEGTSLSGIIYTSKQPADIVKAHSLHVGPTIIPPRWAFLPWRWRDNHNNLKTYYDKTPVNAPYNSALVEDMLMMKAFDIPCGVYWVDRPWAKGTLGYEDFTWDTVRFPRAQKMITWLHSNDTKFLLWIAPWVAGNMKKEADQKGYAQPIFALPHNADSTNAASMDFTNPEACLWWQKNGIEKMLAQGVDGFKLDRSEEEVPNSKNIRLHDGRTLREVRNEYPVLYVKTVNESCKKMRGDDFVLIPRAGYTGSSKYSGFWGGDIAVPAEGLRTAIIAIQRCAVMGYPVWGSDIGGYWQGKLDREVCARWLAFGCFNPIMEVGPTDDRAPWDMPTTPSYDTTLIATWRLYAKIHTNLADYSHNMVKEAHNTGMPVVRPLFLAYPDQKEAWNNWQTFMYGPDILIAAIWQKGTSTHKCYLPEGTNWRDAWEPSKIYKGGQYVEIKTPFHKIPIFLREQSKLDLGDLTELYHQSFNIARQKPDLKALEKTIQ